MSFVPDISQASSESTAEIAVTEGVRRQIKELKTQRQYFGLAGVKLETWLSSLIQDCFSEIETVDTDTELSFEDRLAIVRKELQEAFSEDETVSEQIDRTTTELLRIYNAITEHLLEVKSLSSTQITRAIDKKYLNLDPEKTSLLFWQNFFALEGSIDIDNPDQLDWIVPTYKKLEILFNIFSPNFEKFILELSREEGVDLGLEGDQDFISDKKEALKNLLLAFASQIFQIQTTISTDEIHEKISTSFQTILSKDLASFLLNFFSSLEKISGDSLQPHIFIIKNTIALACQKTLDLRLGAQIVIFLQKEKIIDLNESLSITDIKEQIDACLTILNSEDFINIKNLWGNIISKKENDIKTNFLINLSPKDFDSIKEQLFSQYEKKFIQKLELFLTTRQKLLEKFDQYSTVSRMLQPFVSFLENSDVDQEKFKKLFNQWTNFLLSYDPDKDGKILYDNLWSRNKVKEFLEAPENINILSLIYENPPTTSSQIHKDRECLVSYMKTQQRLKLEKDKELNYILDELILPLKLKGTQLKLKKEELGAENLEIEAAQNFLENSYKIIGEYNKKIDSSKTLGSSLGLRKELELNLEYYFIKTFVHQENIEADEIDNIQTVQKRQTIRKYKVSLVKKAGGKKLRVQEETKKGFKAWLRGLFFLKTYKTMSIRSTDIDKKTALKNSAGNHQAVKKLKEEALKIAAMPYLIFSKADGDAQRKEQLRSLRTTHVALPHM